MKANKLLVLVIIMIGFVYSNPADQKFNGAVAHYNDKEYKQAEIILKGLEKQDYPNTYIYFLLGKIQRYNGNNEEAIKYLEKYIKNPSSDENLMYAQINLAYEYLKNWTKENLDKAKKIVDELIQSKHKNLGDVKYCYAIVYNSYGYYFLQNDLNKDGNVEYYIKAVTYFEKALENRSELVGIANNLCVGYIRIIEKLEENKSKNTKLIKQYASKIDKILSNSQSPSVQLVVASK